MKTANRRRAESTKEFKWRKIKLALIRIDKRRKMLKHTYSCFQSARHREIAYPEIWSLYFLKLLILMWNDLMLKYFFWLSFRLKMCLHLSDVFQIASFAAFINQASQNIPTKRLVDGEKESRLVQQETIYRQTTSSVPASETKYSNRKHQFCRVVKLRLYNLRRSLVMRWLFWGSANSRAAS